MSADTLQKMQAIQECLDIIAALRRELAAEQKRGAAYECEAEKAIADATVRAERAEAELAAFRRNASSVARSWFDGMSAAEARVRELEAELARKDEALAEDKKTLEFVAGDCRSLAAKLDASQARIAELTAELARKDEALREIVKNRPTEYDHKSVLRSSAIMGDLAVAAVAEIEKEVQP